MGAAEGGGTMGFSSAGVEGALKYQLCALARRWLVAVGVSQCRDGGDGKVDPTKFLGRDGRWGGGWYEGTMFAVSI